MFLPSRITLLTHTKRAVGISATAQHELRVRFRLDKLQGTGNMYELNMNMFLYQSVHFYSFAAGLFYLQDGGKQNFI